MIRAGSARVDITPPLDTLLAGTAGVRREAKTVIDPLFVNALVVESNGDPVAFASCDVLGLDVTLVERIRNRVAASTDIPAQNVMVTATHNHTGPQTLRMFRKPEQTYTDHFEKQVASAIRLAADRRDPAEASIAQGENKSYAVNRRYVMDNGETLLTTQIEDPDRIDHVEGPVDPTLSTLTVQLTDGDVVAVLVNYATHTGLTTGDDVSADFPGEIGRVLRAQYGDDTAVLYLPGAGGNIWPFAPTHPEKRDEHYFDPEGTRKARSMGRSLAGTALSTLEPERYASNGSGPVAVETCVETIPVRTVSKDRLTQARDTADDEAASKRDRVLASNLVEFAAFGEENPTLDVEVQGIRVGEGVVVSVPGELFVEFGLDVREAVDAPVLVAGYTNGYLGYLPTNRAYENGGYETTAGWVNRLDPEAGPRLTEAMKDVTKRLIS